jgi:hypothetical protein
MLIIVGIVALGGASDPATGRPNTQAWADWHLVGAIAGSLAILWTYVVAWNNVVANYEVIRKLVDEVTVIRQNRGLDPPNPKAKTLRGLG